MTEKTKAVTLGGHNFQIKKLPADVGSFILMRLMGEAAKAAQNAPSPPPKPADQNEPEVKITPEDRVRALCFVVFSGTMQFELFQFIQRHCMMVVRKMQTENTPMPIMADDGRWADPEIATAHQLIVNLMIEVCIFNFADFFADNATGKAPLP